MKVLLFTLSLLFLGFCSADLEEEFENWSVQYQKNYATEHEKDFRYAVWKVNYQKIQIWNSKQTFGSATFALNEFSDLTPREFRSKYISGYIPLSSNKDSVVTFDDLTIPESVDWRQSGAVTPVKNQGDCGSCWSFATTGTMEGALFIATNNLVGLSEQNLIDCSQSENNDGCNGGRTDWGIQYIINNGGIDTEASYPYTGQDGTCDYSASSVGATATSWNQTATGDETALQIAVATIGPIAVAISVDDSWANYQSGVYVDDSCPNDADDLDHAVLVVGYGTDSNGQDYWIVKNSWGASWGNNGYILMARNHGNMCGIATDAVFPMGVGSK